MNSSPQPTAPVFLCAPTDELTCFGCCPPIRPAGYDHLDHVRSLRREFIDNRRLFLEQGPRYRPIVGFTCWALGFLDATGRRVGCLLHPCGNNGKDLRFLIDYDDKCRRENCLQARLFELLPHEGRLFWLPLVKGLNPFLFSSPRANPLFHLLLWGPKVLEAMRLIAEKAEWSATELLCCCPLLLDTTKNPRALRYILGLIFDASQIASRMLADLPRCCDLIWEAVGSLAREPDALYSCDSQYAVYTHALPMQDDYLDMMRFGLGWNRVDLQRATEFESRVRALAPAIIGEFPSLRPF